MAKLKLSKIEIKPHFVVVDDNGDIAEEVSAQIITMFPGKYMEFKQMQERLETDAMKDASEVQKLIDRPLF